MKVHAKLWHPCGAECLFEYTGQTDPITGLPDFIRGLMRQGWLTRNPKAAPTASTNEQRHRIVAVSHRVANQRGSSVHIADFYDGQMNHVHRILSVYLDTPEQRAAFTAASGLEIEKVADWVGDTSIKRDNPRANQFIVPCRPFDIVTVPNPQYDPAKAEAAKSHGAQPYKTAKRNLLRYEPLGDQQAGQRQKPPSGINEDRRYEPSPTHDPVRGDRDRTMAENAGHLKGPVNGIITEPDLRNLILAKGLTWQVAMQRIDKRQAEMRKPTNLAATAKNAGQIPPDILRPFVEWLRQQPDKLPRPSHTDEHGKIPF